MIAGMLTSLQMHFCTFQKSLFLCSSEVHCLYRDLHQMPVFCFTAQLKVVILQKLVWSSFKKLKKKQPSCYLLHSQDPLWSWAVTTRTWLDPFYIPSFSSTCQSFAELIFYHGCHNQSISPQMQADDIHRPPGCNGGQQMSFSLFYSPSDVGQFV